MHIKFIQLCIQESVMHPSSISEFINIKKLITIICSDTIFLMTKVLHGFIVQVHFSVPERNHAICSVKLETS